MIKINKKQIVFISILIVFISVTTVNAENTTCNMSLNITNHVNNSINGVSSDTKSSKPSVAFESVSRNAKEIKITNGNYINYFNVYTGKILSSADIIAGDTLKIGNVTDKAFTIDRKLTITTICDGDQITNGVIHLIAGSDGSIITGLKIRNSKVSYTVNGISGPMLNGIWLINSSYNIISYNDVQLSYLEGTYVMPMGWSSHNTIIHNRLSSGLTSCMLMSESHYNNISYNYIENTGVKWGVVGNLIYYNPFGHADLGGSGLCVGNYISNNQLYSKYTSEMIIGMQLVYNSHDNTTIINNTFSSDFWSAMNVQGNNLTIQGNHFTSSWYGNTISAGGGSNILIEGNVINAKSGDGIGASGDSVIIKNNSITFSEGCVYAITAGGNAKIINNTINLLAYGRGISAGNGSFLINNTVNTNWDPAIQVSSSNIGIVGNKIKTNSYGIYLVSPDERIYFNFIVNNTITSTLYGIYLEGLIYNTTISGNIIHTNASQGIYKDITDDFGDDNSDNTINDIIYDSTAIVVDDSNFYNYFDKDGNFKFKSFKNDAVIILTHLNGKNLKFNQKVTLLSNGMANSLTGVIITLYSDASGSVIKDLNFYNTNLNAIILAEGVSNVNITGNNITIISNSNFNGSLSGVLICGACEYVNITKNNIFISSDNGSIYGINAVSYNLDNSHFASDFSKYFKIVDNNIILIGNKLAEGIFTDSLIYTNITNNKISVVGGSYGYGIATANMRGFLHDLNVTGNIILVTVRGMAYLIELHMSSNISVVNNFLSGVGSGVYGISAYQTDNVTIKSNNICTTGGDLSLTDPDNLDVLGKGNAAVYLTYNANHTNILFNMVYTNAAKQMIFDKVFNTTLAQNSYVIDDENLLNYFTSRSNGKFLANSLIQANDILLFADLKKYCSLVFDIPLNLTSYPGSKGINASFVLEYGASNSTVSNLIFNLTDKTALSLIDVVNVTVSKNTVKIVDTVKSGMTGILIALNSVSNQIKDNLIDMVGSYALCGISVSNSYQNNYGRSPKFNSISNNAINLKSNSSTNGIYIVMAYNTLVLNNKLSMVSDKVYGVITDYSMDYMGFGTLWTNNTQIVNNTINGNGSLVYLIESLGALNNLVTGNMLYSNSSTSYGYAGFKTNGDMIKSNTILVNGTSKVNGDKISTGQTGVYYSDGSSNNQVTDNYIISTYHPGNDYAVFIAGTAFASNMVTGNYLISDNGRKTADRAVSALFDVVRNNTPVYIFVSPGGNDINGDGSQADPYKSIVYAISQAPNRAVIYLLEGTYHETGVIINKTITLSSYLNGKVVMEGEGKQVFYVSLTGNLLVSNLNITKSGTAFVNYGNLTINNSDVSSNSGTAFVNYGNLIINNSNISNNQGAILNYGGLSVTNSTLSYNHASNGGSISNYGSVSINGCKMNYNTASNGGAIYNDEKGSLRVVNSSFEHNSATDNGGAVENYGYLNVSNCLFNFNKAESGAALFSNSTEKFTILKSNFSYNEASESGGAIFAAMNEGIIDWSVFTKNTAMFGGALRLAGGNIKVTNSIISNNTAVYYAGLYYEGMVTWGHILYQLTMINCSIENNIAMVRGGAFGFENANVNITNSNIVNNSAPKYPTIYTPGYWASIDVRGNYWGITGPDDGVWNIKDILLHDWSKERIDWLGGNPDDSDSGGDGDGDSDPDGGDDSGSNGNSDSWPSLNFDIGTGHTLGHGKGDGIGNGDGNGFGNGDGTGSGLNNNSNGTNGFGNGQSTADYLNNLLNTAGTVAIAAAAGSSSSHGGESGSNSGANSPKVYEISKDKKTLTERSMDILTGLIVVLFFVFLVVMGYMRNKKQFKR